VETVQTCNKNWLLLRPASDQVRQRLEERAADWDHDDRNEKRLLDDAELRLAQKWMEGSDAAEIEPSRELREFVLASEHLSKVNIERQRRIEQQARVAKLSSLISVLAAVGLLAALFGFWQWSKNKDAAEVTERLKREAKETELRYQLQYVEKNALAEASANLKKAYGSLRSGNLDEAESQFNEQLKANIKSDNKAAIGNTYCTLGDIWAKRGNARMAISKYDEALKIFTSDQQFSNDEAQAYLKKAAAHFDLGKQIEAGRNSADALTQYNSSFGFSNKAKVIFTKNKNDAGARDARNAYDVAKRFYDDLKAKLEAPAVLGAEP
jgi:tetratricopeptide (TPR) repeat protein